MARKAVTFCTDGLRDFVVTPDGVRYMLGPVSVLQIATKLLPRGQVRRVLDEFNASGETMTVLDVDALFEMLAPPRRRLLAYSYDRREFAPSLLIPVQNRVPTKGASTMSADKALQDAIATQVTQIEQQIGLLQKSASAASKTAHITKLQALVDGLQNPAPPAAASFDTLTENSNAAETILSQVSEASEMVTKLASQGRRFNATKALADLHGISTRVAEILQHADLAQPWVSNELNDLATKSAHIHGLFSGAK